MQIADIDWDRLYFSYCIVLNRTDEDFWSSSIAKISKMIELYNNQFQQQEQVEQVQEITSMKQIRG